MQIVSIQKTVNFSPANTRSKTKPACQPQSAKILSTNGAKRKKNCANKPQGKSAVQVAIVEGNNYY